MTLGEGEIYGARLQGPETGCETRLDVVVLSITPLETCGVGERSLDTAGVMSGRLGRRRAGLSQPFVSSGKREMMK